MPSPLSLCILGCGDIAHVHARAVRAAPHPVELYFASRSQERADAYAREYGARGIFTSYEAALAAKQVDAVLICTPNHLHQTQACAAMEQGKHVIVEKPMGRSTEEVRVMNRTARRTGRRLLVAENFHYRPSVQTALAVLQAGDLGVPKYFRVHGLSRRRMDAGKWRAREDLMGGGPFIDGGIHWVHLVHAYGGRARRVFAQQQHTEPSFPREDTMAVLCRCTSGMVAALVYSKGMAGILRPQFHALHGSQGSLYMDNAGLLAILRGRRRFLRVFSPRERRGYRAMWRDFLRALTGGAPARMGGVEGALDVAFVEKCYESAATGQAVNLPDVAELS